MVFQLTAFSGWPFSHFINFLTNCVNFYPVLVTEVTFCTIIFHFTSSFSDAELKFWEKCEHTKPFLSSPFYLDSIFNNCDVEETTGGARTKWHRKYNEAKGAIKDQKYHTLKKHQTFGMWLYSFLRSIYLEGTRTWKIRCVLGALLCWFANQPLCLCLSVCSTPLPVWTQRMGGGLRICPLQRRRCTETRGTNGKILAPTYCILSQLFFQEGGC